jgi:hypothetical protein
MWNCKVIVEGYSSVILTMELFPASQNADMATVTYHTQELLTQSTRPQPHHLHRCICNARLRVMKSHTTAALFDDLPMFWRGAD